MPDQRGTRARVVGNELNALQMCIWLKTDLLKQKRLAIYIYIYIYNGNVSEELGRPRGYTPGSLASTFEIQESIMYFNNVDGVACLILPALLQLHRHILLFNVSPVNIYNFSAAPLAALGMPHSLSSLSLSLSLSALQSVASVSSLFRPYFHCVFPLLFSMFSPIPGFPVES